MTVPKFSKPRSPKQSEIQNVPHFSFDSSAQGHDWLVEHIDIPGATEHVLEYRFVNKFVQSLDKIDNLACNRLNQTYKYWAKDNVSHDHDNTSC